LQRYENLLIPASSSYILFILGNVSNFSIMKEKNVQNWLKDHIFGQAEALQEFLFGQGTFMLALYVFIPLLIALGVLMKLKNNSALVQKIRNKVMWSSVFRS